MHASGKQSFLEDTRLFRIFQGCFTVQLSRFFAVVLVLSSNFYIISLLFKFVNNFFIYFSIFRLKLCVSCCLSQTASLYYHPSQHLSTAFFIFLQNPPPKRAGYLFSIYLALEGASLQCLNEMTLKIVSRY